MIQDNKVIAGNSEILLKGNPLDPYLQAIIQEVRVEQETDSPAMFSVKFNMGDFAGFTQEKMELLNGFFKVGDEVAISMGFDSLEKLIVGEIFAIEPNLQETITLEVRGYDVLQKLKSLPEQNSENQTFTDKKFSEIASTLAQAAKASVNVEDSGKAYPYILRNNRNYYQFLKDIKPDEYEILVEDKTLYIRKAQPDSASGLKFEYGTDLQSFSLQVKAPPKSVEVKGMDLKTKKPIVAKATCGTQSAFAADGGVITVSDETIVDQEHAETIAKEKCASLSRNLFTGSGKCCGNPQVKIGKTVEISGIGDVFGGIYYITSATHQISDDGYTTTFKASKRG
jgi:Bacteriophage probable baseplate hub protein